MPRNGSGTYNLPTGQPVVTGTSIASATFNTFTNDIATEMTKSICSDGQTPMGANFNLGLNKIVNLSNGTGAADSVNYAQMNAAILAGPVGAVVAANNYTANQFIATTSMTSPLFTGALTGNASTATLAANSSALGGNAAALFALLADPAFTGSPTAPTASLGTATTQLATTAFVNRGGTSAVTGSIEFPNGLILKWATGANSASSGAQNVSYNAAFPNSVFATFVCSIYGVSNQGGGYALLSTTTSQATVARNNVDTSNGVTPVVFAIGN